MVLPVLTISKINLTPGAQAPGVFLYLSKGGAFPSKTGKENAVYLKKMDKYGRCC